MMHANLLRWENDLTKLIEEGSSVCDDEVSNVVEDVLNKDMKELPSTDARRIFWEQQVHKYIYASWYNINYYFIPQTICMYMT